MYTALAWFALIQHDGQLNIKKEHGKFADEQACEYAASIVEQDLHPLPRGHRIECLRRVEIILVPMENG